MTVAGGKQAAVWRGSAGDGRSPLGAVEVEDARPLLPGKSPARTGAAPAKEQLPSVRLTLLWGAMFTLWAATYSTSLMVSAGRSPSG